MRITVNHLVLSSCYSCTWGVILWHSTSVYLVARVSTASPTLSTEEGNPPGETPLMRADIPDLVRAVVAALDSTASRDAPAGKSLNDKSAPKKCLVALCQRACADCRQKSSRSRALLEYGRHKGQRRLNY